MSATQQHDGGAPRLHWHYLAHCEVGLVRKNNQDSGLASSEMLAVADGMGGAAAGDLASAIAVDTLRSALPAADHRKPLESVSQALGSANERIADLIAADATLDGMGTTATVAVLDDDQLRLAHIGDSRAYLFRDGHLEQLTHDHSWVQSLVDDGKISETEAQVHPHRSLLLRVINGQASSEPDLASWPCRLGDRLMLCSDGLCGFVPDELIAAALAETDQHQAMEGLVDAAHQAGGLDNITILLADVSGPGTAGPDSTQTGSRIAGARTGSRSPSTFQQAAGPDEQTHIFGAAADDRVAALESKTLGRGSYDADTKHDANGGDETAQEPGPDPAKDAGADVPADEDRYAPQPPRRRRFWKPVIVLVAVVLVLAAAAAAGFTWTRTQYYVGDDGGRVAIYQGLHKTFPGVRLSRVYRVQALRTSDLPRYYQKRVHTTIDADSLSSARATVHQLEDVAKHCRIRTRGAKSDKSGVPAGKSSPGKHQQPSKNKSSGKHARRGKHKSSGAPRATGHHKPNTPTAVPSPIRSGPLSGGGRC